MDLSWLQGWSLHSLVLKNLELEKHFNVGMFPAFKVYPGALGIAYYHRAKDYIGFDADTFLANVDGFDHLIFHELMHSTDVETLRWKRLNFDAHIDDAYNLEEQIAEVGAFILLEMFSDTSSWNPTRTLTERFVKYYETDLAFPWGEVERAVKYYLVKKDCPKLKKKLEYYKQVVSQITTVYEGQFNGQLQTQPEKTTNARRNGSNARSFAV